MQLEHIIKHRGSKGRAQHPEKGGENEININLSRYYQKKMYNKFVYSTAVSFIHICGLAQNFLLNGCGFKVKKGDEHHPTRPLPNALTNW